VGGVRKLGRFRRFEEEKGGEGEEMLIAKIS
jgi:hypothetical protein